MRPAPLQPAEGFVARRRVLGHPFDDSQLAELRERFRWYLQGRADSLHEIKARALVLSAPQGSREETDVSSAALGQLAQRPATFASRVLDLLGEGDLRESGGHVLRFGVAATNPAGGNELAAALAWAVAASAPSREYRLRGE